MAARLRKVVFWSAFVPAEGRPLYDEIPPAYQEMFDQLAQESGNNSIAMPYEVWQSAFINDATEDVARVMPPGDYGFHRFADRLGVSPLMTPGSHEVCFTQQASLAGAFRMA